MSKFQGRNGDMLEFWFQCEGCQVEGSIQLDVRDGYSPFGCPEDCGATYIPWQPVKDQWALKCVVLPIYKKVDEIRHETHTPKA